MYPPPHTTCIVHVSSSSHKLPQGSGCNMYPRPHMTCIVHVSSSSYDLPQGLECLEGALLEGSYEEEDTCTMHVI